MIPGVSAVAVYPVAVFDLDYGEPSPVQALLADPDADLIWTLSLFPQPLNASESDFPYAFATQPFAALAEDEEKVDNALYFADRMFQTGPTETPANENFAPRLLDPFNFEAALPLPGADGAATAGFGAIKLANGDGALDALLRDYSLLGQVFEVRVGGTLNRGRAGERTLLWSEFGLVFRGTVAAILGDRDAITLSIFDPARKLERPARRTLYGGTGGADGDAAVTGRPKPRAYGVCLNVPALLIVAADLLYQVSDGSIRAVDAVRDKGVALAFDADYADLAALLAATVATGEYATCLALGLIRLGAAPEGQVTVDLEGADDPDYAATAPEIARRIAVDIGGLTDPDDIDAAAFAAIPTNAPVGIWLPPDELATWELLRRVMASIDGWVGFTRAGLLTVGQFVAPETEAAEVVLDAGRDAGMSLTASEDRPPVWRYRLGYAPMTAVQDADALAAGVSAADRALYGRSYSLTAPVSDSNVDALHALARDEERPTLLADSEDADDEAARLLLRDGVIRRAYEMQVTRGILQHRLGQVVRVEIDALGIPAGGKNLLVTRLAENAAANTVTLGLWG